MKNKKVSKYRSPAVERLFEEMKDDPWYIKLKRWYVVEKWVLICRTRKFWDKTYEHYLFKKNNIKTTTSNEDELYGDIEYLIIQWNNDGTKTAGELTRQIMSLLKKE
jgi:hypothetical protein